ncbi:hypothetical protein BX600DRAFT_21232 [Xylariales sp. PMI_506]|nr:hypothetical protein BX600DRAFT_21232 [Xylariales sp. PMI_506]
MQEFGVGNRNFSTKEKGEKKMNSINEIDKRRRCRGALNKLFFLGGFPYFFLEVWSKDGTWFILILQLWVCVATPMTCAGIVQNRSAMLRVKSSTLYLWSILTTEPNSSRRLTLSARTQVMTDLRSCMI